MSECPELSPIDVAFANYRTLLGSSRAVISRLDSFEPHLTAALLSDLTLHIGVPWEPPELIPEHFVMGDISGTHWIMIGDWGQTFGCQLDAILAHDGRAWVVISYWFDDRCQLNYYCPVLLDPEDTKIDLTGLRDAIENRFPERLTEYEKVARGLNWELTATVGVNLEALTMQPRTQIKLSTNQRHRWRKAKSGVAPIPAYYVLKVPEVRTRYVDQDGESDCEGSPKRPHNRMGSWHLWVRARGLEEHEEAFARYSTRATIVYLDMAPEFIQEELEQKGHKRQQVGEWIAVCRSWVKSAKIKGGAAVPTIRMLAPSNARRIVGPGQHADPELHIS